MNASSSDDCLDDVDNYALRKKMRKRRKMRVITKKQLQNIETISDGESQSEGVIGINDSDCSDTHIQSSMLGHPHAHGPFLSAISDLLSGAENDGHTIHGYEILLISVQMQNGVIIEIVLNVRNSFVVTVTVES